MIMDIKNLPTYSIGVFDSGVGGLTVMRELLKLLPDESFIYLGDTARLPYGEKSRETVIAYSLENADFLLAHHIKLLAVACNTASAHALEALRQHCNVPVVGVIAAGAQCALQATRNGRIAVLGTRGTIQSQAYQQAISDLDPHAVVVGQACPLLVPLVEERFADHLAARLVVREYLKPLQDKGIDTVLLGCTHYPLLQDLIREEMGHKAAVVDAAVACAGAVADELKRHQLSAPGLQARPRCRFFVSDDPGKFQSHADSFMDAPLVHVEQIPKKF
jgi:glutamate racemase